MFEVREISKIYHSSVEDTVALDGVSITFRSKGLVAILGPSGSGKTTFLNILGGLDHPDCGEIRIRDVSLDTFTAKEWDAYRNNSIGFVFQNYHLLPEISILDNVILTLSLSGMRRKQAKEKAIEMLERLGLTEIMHKRPPQLSNGQIQRAAIARALVNDPPILLCDEPTGSMDTENSIAIMDMLKEESAKRLVIIVTHNEDLADAYADRIVYLKDGEIIGDSRPYQMRRVMKPLELKKTRLGIFTALHLAFRNLFKKKGRSLLTVLGSSIGIAALALSIAVATSFQERIQDFEASIMQRYPVIVNETKETMPIGEAQERLGSGIEVSDAAQEFELLGEYEQSTQSMLYDEADIELSHTNNLTSEYVDFVKDMNPADCDASSIIYDTNLNIIVEKDGTYSKINLAKPKGDTAGEIRTVDDLKFHSYPAKAKGIENQFLKTYYDILAGEYPESPTDIVLVVDHKNRISRKLLSSLGYSIGEDETIAFDRLLGRQIFLVQNDDYYVELGAVPEEGAEPVTVDNEEELLEQGATFAVNPDYNSMVRSSRTKRLTIVGVVRSKPEANTLDILDDGVAYSNALIDMIMADNNSSAIVIAQRGSDVNVLDGKDVSDAKRMRLLINLGGHPEPDMVVFYPRNRLQRDRLRSDLDEHNAEIEALEQRVIYRDLSVEMTESTKGILRAILMILWTFTVAALAISVIVIVIMMYTSVRERRQEIGTLRAIGARKRDIVRIFNTEALIIGMVTGAVGVILAFLLKEPLNEAIYLATGLTEVARIEKWNALAMILSSGILAMLGGQGPSLLATRKDVAEALRND